MINGTIWLVRSGIVGIIDVSNGDKIQKTQRIKEGCETKTDGAVDRRAVVVVATRGRHAVGIAAPTAVPLSTNRAGCAIQIVPLTDVSCLIICPIKRWSSIRSNGGNIGIMINI